MQIWNGFIKKGLDPDMIWKAWFASWKISFPIESIMSLVFYIVLYPVREAQSAHPFGENSYIF